MEDLCLFNAFKLAAEIAGRPDIVTQDDIDGFVEREKTAYGIDLTLGMSWDLFLVFLRELRDAGRDFKFKEIAEHNFAIPGRCGARIFEEVELRDGLYLCAAYTHWFVGHAFVLQVQGDRRLVFDQDQVILLAAADWINFVAFIRPFIVFG
ncbi:hypothetical protein PI124_g21627 [Phytophthora idaei]|nr:hypothetical protein PI125_g23427 [Phytophthora idaei]KAG3128327.1 hypothetical protein PI126_g21451 [Phytophthora idaei]KAG3233296.1 hypothetical protein PI124_g21627 [Phytophthora idaei]